MRGKCVRLLATGWLASALWMAQGLAAEPGSVKGKIVVLDPGHAVKNPQGVIINPGMHSRDRQVWERVVTLQVAEKLGPLLEAEGAQVYYTRTSDHFWRVHRVRREDNRMRAEFANEKKADALIRLHCDWNRSRRTNGFCTYYYRWSSRSLAQALHAALRSRLGQSNRGIRQRSFASATAQMPTVLIELGFLSNAREVKLLSNESYQGQMAAALAEGVRTYFGSRQK